MLKKAILAVILIFITWSVMDYLIHHVMLGQLYMETADLWRSVEEMQTYFPLMYLTSLILCACIVAIYVLLIKDKSISSAMIYCVLLGLAHGISMGLGTYTYSPIPFKLALSWFLGTFVEYIAAGLIIGVILRPAKESIEAKTE